MRARLQPRNQWDIYDRETLVTPPFENGKQCQLVPIEHADVDPVDTIAKRDAVAAGETRTYGQLITVGSVQNEVQERRTPVKISLPLLATKHAAFNRLSPDAMIKWGTIIGARRP
jgi:hypothetical protein